MSKSILLITACLALLMITGCNQQSEPTDEYVFAVQLVNDSVKMHEYVEYHKKVWPEVEDGFTKAGYKNIRLYRFNNYITMIVEVPEGADLNEIGKTEALHTDRVNEWNTLMTTYQKGLPGVKEGTTWVAMEKIYEFSND